MTRKRETPDRMIERCCKYILLWTMSFCSYGAWAGPQLIHHLPNLTIHGFAQDKVGYVWIATDNGLCRYNGQFYYYYQNEPEDPASLPGNRVSDIRSDGSGTLWIITSGGVCTYDARLDSFRRLLGREGFSKAVLNGEHVVCSGPGGMALFDSEGRLLLEKRDTPRHGPVVLEADPNGYLWGGVNGGRVFKYDRDLNVCDSLTLPDSAEFLSSCRDAAGRIWFGTPSGIHIVDPCTGALVETDESLHTCLTAVSQSAILSLTAIGETIYIGTQGDNLHQIDIRTNALKKNIVTRGTPGLNYTSDFSCCFFDSENNFWIGTGDRGYSVRYANEKEFTRSVRLGKQTQGKFINAITISKDGTRWIGSRFKGLLAYSSQLDLKWYTMENCTLMQQLDSKNISALFADSSGRLWINIDDRIACCNTSQLTISDYILLPERFSANRFCEDTRHNVWAATTSGLLVYDGTRLRATRFEGCDVQDVIRLNDTTMLAAVFRQGLFAIDSRKLEWRPYLEAPDSLTATALRRATCLLKDKDGQLWIGTRSKGLLRYHPIQGFRTYTLKDGFASNEIAAVAQDRKGNMWAATSYGLSLITSSSERIITYLRSDKMQTQQFHPRCVCNTSNMLYFGGNMGLVHFKPESILPKISKRPVRLVLREIKVNSVVQQPSDDGILTQQLNDTERIVLDHKQRNLDINYEALAFLSPEKIRYAYRLHGGDIDEEWNYVENRTSANYSHLPAGRYVFELTAQNPDGFWNSEPRRLEIVIKPSPLLTWYAFLFYILTAGTAAWFANRLFLRRRLQKMELETTRKELEREKELTNMKINFFTNISHELRTPLTLIYGPVNMLPDIQDKKRLHELINLINDNIQRLLKLVDQTLSLSRIENDTLPLSVCRQDILPLVERMMAGFACYAREKRIAVSMTSTPPGRMIVAVDADKFSKILSNLVSNALKYTPKDGHVEVALTLTDTLPKKLTAAASSHYLVASVTDNGAGMSQKDVERIFERYKRLTASEHSSAGSGIGLHYVKQLLLIHKGSIVAEIRPEGGMRFTFAIPVDESLYDIAGEPTVEAEFIDGMATAIADCPGDKPDTTQETGPRPKMVIVEDNPQLRRYCRQIFAPQFDVFTADNGSDGFDLIHAEMPDIVITDVLMSKMDGYELCRKIKTDVLLSHIPVVILTAKVTDQDKITGYQEGADVYMTKPFNPTLLQTVVGNLLTSRSKLREMLLSGAEKPRSEPEGGGEIRLSSADRAFVDKLCQYVDANISDCSLSISAISTEMCMSRASFFRKIKSLTGVTPNNFILIYRLNKAAAMIRSREYRLNEIADMVGFSSQSHFSRCFKQHFGMAPKDYTDHGGGG